MADEVEDKVVKVTLNSDGLPVPNEDPVPVRKDKQKIKWCATFPFTISIVGYTDVKPGTGSGDCAHTAKTGNFKDPVGTRFKYSITANDKTNDPDIDIQP